MDRFELLESQGLSEGLWAPQSSSTAKHPSASEAPSVGDMTEFGAVDVNALQDGRVETFHGTDCSEDTFRQFREWLTPRMPVVFVSDNPAYDFQWINFYFWRYFGENPFGHSG